MKTYPLSVFVRRVLLIRLAGAAAVIALVIGVAAFFVQRSQLADEVVDLGRRGVRTLVDNVRATMEREHSDGLTALREVVGRGERPVVYHAGRFVYLQIYDRASRVLAEESAADQPNIRDLRTSLESWPFTFPDAGHEEVRWARVDGDLFVYVTAPVPGRAGATVAYARGVFAVSPEATARMHRAVARNVILAVGIVLVVVALLYPVILHLMRRLAHYSTHLLEANLETLAVLGSAIAKRDSDTDAHNYRVSLYSARIGEALGLAPSAMRVLIKGSFLHDVGKIGIPDQILLKPGGLDEKEFATMKTHVENGVDIVQRSSWLRDSVSVVGYHHEKYAGGGYPYNLSGEDIPITARIFAVSDVFDALTSSRPYKEPFSFDEAMDILEQGRGRHFDPRVLDAFGTNARELYDRYAGHEGEDLLQELVAMVEKYFSAGMETLRYGEESERPTDAR
jgi:HD-GYP domain-containing protein (c-di-GMP phosphodiesterase class II)